MAAHTFDTFRVRQNQLQLARGDRYIYIANELRDALKKFVNETAEGTLPAVLAFVAEVAGSSPFHDIDKPGAELHHGNTPAQQLSLFAIEELLRLATLHTEAGKGVMQHLDKLATTSADFHIRKASIETIRKLGIRQQRARAYAFAVLERQSVQNSNPFMRTEARTGILEICHIYPSETEEYKNLTDRIVVALINGTQDAHPVAAGKAFVNLKFRATSHTCSAEEAASILSFFKKAAADERFARAPFSDCANRGTTGVVDEGIRAINRRVNGSYATLSFP